MAEFQLEGPAAESEAAELVAEANSEDRRAAEQLADIRDGIGDRLGIAGAIGEKHAVGLEREHVFGGSFRRNDGDVAAVIHEQAQNILLDAEIVGDHAVALARIAVAAMRRVLRAAGVATGEPQLPRAAAAIGSGQIDRAARPFV